MQLLSDGFIIGENVRNARKQLGISQAKAAELSGLATKSYADFERGQSFVRLDNFIRICEALQTTPDSLLLPSGEKDIYTLEHGFYKRILTYVANICSDAISGNIPDIKTNNEAF